nr:MAG TPA: hypothetical protein [Caudoviricetes sp.]
MCLSPYPLGRRNILLSYSGLFNFSSLFIWLMYIIPQF